MPRTADHDARRAQICRGVREVALQGGLGSVTVAGTARQAGVSVGLVQHYYASKELVLIDALGAVLGDILTRVERASARAERRHARIETMLAAGLEQLLPLDKVRREEAYLRHAFAGLALDHEVFRAHQEGFTANLADRTGRAIRNAFECGEIPDPAVVDPGLEAYSILALAEGLAAQLLIRAGRVERRRAREAIAARTRALFPGPCLRHLPERVEVS